MCVCVLLIWGEGYIQPDSSCSNHGLINWLGECNRHAFVLALISSVCFNSGVISRTMRLLCSKEAFHCPITSMALLENVPERSMPLCVHSMPESAFIFESWEPRSTGNTLCLHFTNLFTSKPLTGLCLTERRWILMWCEGTGGLWETMKLACLVNF